MNNQTPDVNPVERSVRLQSPTQCPWATSFSAAVFVLLSVPAQSQVRFDEKADRIAVEVNGKPFTVLHYGKAEGKPYLHPLMTASGKAVTRGFPDDPLPGDPTDRPHLRGLIIGHEEVSTPSGGELDFWENDPHPWYKHKKGFIVVKEAKTAARDHRPDDEKFEKADDPPLTANTRFAAGSGEAGLFILPGYEFKTVGGMLTNFHLPKSTLIMLVSAFAGKDRILAAYDHAVAERYRFYSYGDCMLIL